VAEEFIFGKSMFKYTKPAILDVSFCETAGNAACGSSGMDKILRALGQA